MCVHNQIGCQSTDRALLGGAQQCDMRQGAENDAQEVPPDHGAVTGEGQAGEQGRFFPQRRGH